MIHLIKKNEIIRKIIHLSSAIYPILYMVTDSRAFMIYSLGSIMLLLFSLEISRFKYKKFNISISRFFKHSIRDYEIYKITGASYFIFGSFITIMLFEKSLAIVALFILIIADTAAAIIGLSFGEYKIYNNKTLVGTTSFIITGIFISVISYFYFTPNLLFLGLLLSVIGTSLVELFSDKLKLDDNLLIPISFCILYNIYELL